MLDCGLVGCKVFVEYQFDVSVTKGRYYGICAERSYDGGTDRVHGDTVALFGTVVNDATNRGDNFVGCRVGNASAKHEPQRISSP